MSNRNQPVGFCWALLTVLRPFRNPDHPRQVVTEHMTHTSGQWGQTVPSTGDAPFEASRLAAQMMRALANGCALPVSLPRMNAQRQTIPALSVRSV